MSNVEKLDRWIYWFLGGYALTFSISVGVANVFFWLTILFAVIRTMKSRPYFTIPVQYIRAIIVFLGIFLCLTLTSPDFVVAIKRVWEFAERMIPLLLVGGFIKDKKQIISLLILMLISISLNDIVAIWQGLHGNYRAGGLGGHVMDSAGVLVQIIPILTILIISKAFPDKNKYLIFSLCISSIAVLFNGTRVAWLTLLVVLPLVAFMYYRSIRKVLPYLIVILLILSIVVGMVPFLKNRVESIPNPEHRNNQERVLVWNSAWQMFRDHPITGVGLDQYTYRYQTEYISPIAKERTLAHAHNNFLQMLAENGSIGFLAFCFMFGSFLFYSLKDWLRYREISSLMFFAITSAILLQGLTDFNFGLTKMMRLYFCLMAMYLQYRYGNMNYIK